MHAALEGPRVNDGLPVELAHQVAQQFCREHPERYLLAFVYGYLGEYNLLRVRTDAEKDLLMAALNLVEFVAIGARNCAPSPRRWPQRCWARTPKRGATCCGRFAGTRRAGPQCRPRR